LIQYSILVVDDDEDILTILRDNLILDGYSVATAGTGKKALAAIQDKTFDVVVLDLMLPDIDGVQVCRSIRAKANTPILLLTAKDRLSDKVLGLESGADDYMVKPFDYLELAARVKALLRRSHAYSITPGVEIVGPFALQPQTRSVGIDSRSIALTKKEFDILELLMRHAGKVLERDAIRKALWPDDKLYRWSRTIDVHIQHLRAKLEDDPETPRYIITIQGIGYMLDVSS
jgi:DNA-binding response OmpR family regulator